MRYPASEKLEIIRLVEESTLPVRRTLEKIEVPHAIFYRWCDLYQTGAPEALEDQQPKPDASGIAFRMMFASKSSGWRWMSRRCRREN
jgi:transposase-like protein